MHEARLDFVMMKNTPPVSTLSISMVFERKLNVNYSRFCITIINQSLRSSQSIQHHGSFFLVYRTFHVVLLRRKLWREVCFREGSCRRHKRDLMQRTTVQSSDSCEKKKCHKPRGIIHTNVCTAFDAKSTSW